MPKKILVIEDNPSMLENIADIIWLANYEAITAPNGKQGVELAKKFSPDLILCDVMMPELDGYGVFYILHKDPETASIPFIFLTAKADPGDFRTGMNLGADDYVTKPFENYDLLKVIETRLKKNEEFKTHVKNELSDLHSFLSIAKEHEGLENLSESRPVRSFRKKEYIYMEGQTPTDVYFISKGEIKTYITNHEGKELITGIHHSGDFIGYVELLQEIPYIESAVVLEDVDLSLISKQDFMSLIYSNSDVAFRFIKLLSNNQIENEERLLNLAYQSVRQRVAGALLHIYTSKKNITEDPLISISRKDIANIVGTATESLNRTLADFADENMIEIVNHGLRITDKVKLEKILK